MKLGVFLVAILVVVGPARALPIAQMATAPPSVWPHPASITFDGSVMSVYGGHDLFSYVSDSMIPPPTLKDAMKRYESISFPHVPTNAAASGSVLAYVRISVDDEDESHPQLGVDESYNLTIPKGNGSQTLQGSLHAKTIWGAMRGLETFSQITVFDFDTQRYMIWGCSVQDSPRFAHRGLMIDTARHFETLASLRSLIDSLTYAKLNVLHWHMVDTQSFPFESKSYPKLWAGAYSDQERYTQADIATIVEYARKRAVRVIVEFDVPGHAASWCTGYPEICPSPSCLQPLNVATNATFDLITSLLAECTGNASSTKKQPMGLFPDNMIHLGGDEVDTTCWSKTPSVANWLAGNNMTADQGYAYFVKRVEEIAIAQGRRPIQWEEVFVHFGSQLAKQSIVHVWKSIETLPKITQLGYNALINVGYYNESWYLDNLNINWTAVYVNEPCKTVPDDQCPLVLGGHGEMWGETVDMSDAEQTIWPKMAAIAERLWSTRDVNDVQKALPRIEAFRCLLNRRGIRAAPVNNANARSAPAGPGSCFAQR